MKMWLKVESLEQNFNQKSYKKVHVERNVLQATLSSKVRKEMKKKLMELYLKD